MLDARIIEFSEYLADEARKILLPYYRAQFRVEDKADQTPVTDADKLVEKTIRKLIENNYPEHGIYGEEYGETAGSGEFTWVIDPIDGTKSFITGRPLFGTLVALVKDEKPVLGLIDIPVLQERWLAANDWVKLNNQPIKSRRCVLLEDAYFATTSPFLFDEQDIRKVQYITNRAKCTIYGGDCYSYGQLAHGTLDLVIESGLKPYDFCALVPIVENAGGRISDWGGNDITVKSSGKILACGDRELHGKVRDLLI